MTFICRPPRFSTLLVSGRQAKTLYGALLGVAPSMDEADYAPVGYSDVGAGKLTASMKDADGNAIGLIQSL